MKNRETFIKMLFSLDSAIDPIPWRVIYPTMERQPYGGLREP